MHVHPTRLERQGSGRLLIEWSDGQRRIYTYREIQENCPCATCREKRAAPEKPDIGLLPVITAQEAQPLELVRMQPVGNYAYQIHFNYGCESGIYTFELLRHLGSEVT
jgi:DUF971 family protein